MDSLNTLTILRTHRGVTVIVQGAPSITDPDVSHTYDCIDENKTSARDQSMAEVEQQHSIPLTA